MVSMTYRFQKIRPSLEITTNHCVWVTIGSQVGHGFGNLNKLSCWFVGERIERSCCAVVEHDFRVGHLVVTDFKVGHETA